MTLEWRTPDDHVLDLLQSFEETITEAKESGEITKSLFNILNGKLRGWQGQRGNLDSTSLEKSIARLYKIYNLDNEDRLSIIPHTLRDVDAIVDKYNFIKNNLQKSLEQRDITQDYFTIYTEHLTNALLSLKNRPTHDVLGTLTLIECDIRDIITNTIDFPITYKPNRCKQK